MMQAVSSGLPSRVTTLQKAPSTHLVDVNPQPLLPAFRDRLGEAGPSLRLVPHIVDDMQV